MAIARSAAGGPEPDLAASFEVEPAAEPPVTTAPEQAELVTPGEFVAPLAPPDLAATDASEAPDAVVEFAKPAVPFEPAPPEVPEVPEVPQEPAEPEQPAEPAALEHQAVPSEPAEPAAPVAPLAPLAATAAPAPTPVAPVTPVVPGPARLPGSYIPRSDEVEAASWTLQPSHAGSEPRQGGTSISLSVGAIPASAAIPVRPTTDESDGRDSVRTPLEPQAGRGQAPPASPFATAPLGFASPLPAAAPRVPASVPPIARPTGFIPTSPFGAQPFVPPAPTAPVPAAVAPPAAEPARKESIQELIAFGLVAAGAVLGVASLFLPWTGVSGFGIGTTMTTSAPPPPNQWGWGMPASIPLFVLGVLVLAAASGSDRVQQRLPRLAPVIGRVTDLILPMILGGLYLGIVLLYVTLPQGFGSGLFLGQLSLLVGAVLLIAGAIVTMFFPPKTAEGSAGQ